MKKCSKCKKEKNSTEFYKNKHEKDGLHGWCKICSKEFDHIRGQTPKRKEYQKKRSQTPRLKNLRKKYYNDHREVLDYRIKLSLKRAKKRAKEKNILFEINLEWTKKQWEKQNGKCLLSGMPFDLTPSSYRVNPYSPSLDRIDSSMGYTKDNTRLILSQINFSINEYGFEEYLKIAKACLNNLLK